MNQLQNSEYSKQIYYRLISLWVICEAFAGGMMHAASLPFTGLIVSSLAITCIILIAYHVPERMAIIKATIIVAIFKLMLSPHSPPTAYMAVFFQGLMGQLLFSKRKYFNIAAILLAILALVESAIQRLIVLVIVYGNNLWRSVNTFIQKLTGEKETNNYSLLIAIFYILLHALIGIIVGIYAARFAVKSANWKNKYPKLIIDKRITETETETDNKKSAGSKKLKFFFILIWIILLAFYIQSFINPAHTIFPSGIIINILLRSMLIILSWYLVLAPLTILLIKRLLRSSQLQYKQEINSVMELIPQTKMIFTESFRLSGYKNGFARIKLFLKILLINILAD